MKCSEMVTTIRLASKIMSCTGSNDGLNPYECSEVVTLNNQASLGV